MKSHEPHIGIFYRNFAARSHAASHIGLGVNAVLTAKVLRAEGIACDVHAAWVADDVRRALRAYPETTIALVEAPWISLADQAALCHEFPRVEFVVRLHSQIGFLQVEAGAIRLMRDLIGLEEGALNFRLAANARNLCSFVERTYGARCLYLPNLYDVTRAHRKAPRAHAHRALRVASFGALRLLKNHTTAAAGALMAAEARGADLEFHVSVNREEHGRGVLDSLKNMFEGLRFARLVPVPWEPWPAFRRTIAGMDLCIQVSHTETFNIVTADAAAEHVPTVASSAIDWLPRHFHADADDAGAVGRVAGHLLSDHNAGAEARASLERYVASALGAWRAYLGGEK